MAGEIKGTATYSCKIPGRDWRVLVEDNVSVEKKEGESPEALKKRAEESTPPHKSSFTGLEDCRFKAITGIEEKKEPIKIGMLASTTGAQAVAGTALTNAAKLALEKINAAGGVHGRPIEFLIENDNTKETEGPMAATKLIENRVVALLGAEGSGITLGVVPIVERARIPMVACFATNPKVTVAPSGEVSHYIFRSVFEDNFQGTVMARFARETLHTKTASIFVDYANDYAVGIAGAFRKSFVEMGGQILMEEKYAHEDQNFKAQLINFRSQSPDVLFVPDSYGDVGLIAKQAREVGLSTIFLGGDGWDHPANVQIGGPAIEGSYFSNHYSMDIPNPAAQEFVKAYQEKYKEEPNVWGILGYEGTLLLVDALQRAERPEPELIRGALEMTKNFHGITGDITINAHHDADKPAVVLTIKEGKYKFVQRIQP